MYYIDGSRIKTETKFFTPILGPAMKVLEKYDFKLPKISNQKANDYLHVIQMELHIRQKLTFHGLWHSFATMALAHDVPIENVRECWDTRTSRQRKSTPRSCARQSSDTPPPCSGQSSKTR